MSNKSILIASSLKRLRLWIEGRIFAARRDRVLREDDLSDWLMRDIGLGAGSEPRPDLAEEGDHSAGAGERPSASPLLIRSAAARSRRI